MASARFLLGRFMTAFLMALLLPVSGMAQPAVVSPPVAGVAGANTVPNKTYILGPEDVIEVSVLGRSDFTTRARVRSDGTIELPYIGKIQAANRSASELSDVIARGLSTAGIYSNPAVSVEVVGYASRYVIVLGAVGNPGLVPIDRPYRLSEILARVGGLRETAAEYVIQRPENGPERRISVRELATGDATADPYVAAGDKIYSPVAETFYVAGQVHAPGSFTYDSNVTVRMAIARGGGLTETGSDKKVQISRAGKMIPRVALDTKLQPGDVVIVGERLF